MTQAKGPHLYFLAVSAQETYAEAHIAALKWRNESWASATVYADDQKVDLLQNTGATSSCLTTATFDKLLNRKSLVNDSGMMTNGTRKVDLREVAQGTLQVRVKG